MRVLPLDDTAAALETVGGKGASLARLARAGLPVPDGFHITTDAYREFVAPFRDRTATASGSTASEERSRLCQVGDDGHAPRSGCRA
ncbi:PEP/pyruvate-binding domain-containing protein [Nonomuraea recticatena]|uniref:Pyruvate phosphate dikinase AMP/ATP-binding domain-containing protein n=1 Tax=Nonomuraea recticatena TaxID=46178 RepID=A0ABN3RE17_9ACTN